MRLLLIDNYDSFTYNLFQLLAGATGEAPVVVRNDAVPLAELGRGEFDGVVISPGPGRPDRRADFGACREVILGAEVPVLGVCLGHQGIATAFGGGVVRAEPVHGRATWISQAGAPMFAGLPERFRAVRYHSLVVAEPLPDCLRATAWSEDGAVMALSHRERPIWGMQFHPESAGTELGGAMIESFVRLVGERGVRPRRAAAAGSGPADTSAVTDPPTHRLVVRSLPHQPDPAATFRRLFGGEPYAFWIDREASGDAPAPGLSIMGAAGGPGAEVLTYEVGSGTVSALAPASGRVERIEGTIFEALRRRLGERRTPADHPLAPAAGYVGYLGYELKADLGSPGRHSAATPDACLIYSPRLVVFDHRSGETHAVRVVGPGEDLASAEAEAESMRRELAAVTEPDASALPRGDRPLHFALDRERYLGAIAEAQRHLRAGDSYELCLTNRIAVETGEQVDPLGLYLRLRRKSPAPQAAYLRLGEAAVLSASPERFLRIDPDGLVETSPIKGTRPRGADPEADRALREELLSSDKEQAENLMIVDVLRNDLGRVCEIGSVEVERLREVQSFAQVHQLVSTIAGRLAPGRDPIDCVESCFPGGSMTGAPKLRSMEILDALEPAARGPYAGALGCFSLAGAVDLSIVIRTITLAGGRATIGTGGAVTVLSDPGAEHAEMLLKAQPLLELLGGGGDVGGACAESGRSVGSRPGMTDGFPSRTDAVEAVGEAGRRKAAEAAGSAPAPAPRSRASRRSR
jgi:para-aminobenzoate synthetase